MKIFLITLGFMMNAYRSDWHSFPAVTEMPSMAACQAVAKAISEMEPKSKVRCVAVPH